MEVRKGRGVWGEGWFGGWWMVGDRRRLCATVLSMVVVDWDGPVVMVLVGVHDADAVRKGCACERRWG